MKFLFFTRISAQLIGSNVGSSVGSNPVSVMASPVPATVLASSHPLTSAPINSTVIVSSSTSSMVGQVKCTGINDLWSIQAAVTALLLYDGGTVVLSDGVFNINGSIKVLKNTTFIGQSDGTTVLKVRKLGRRRIQI